MVRQDDILASPGLSPLVDAYPPGRWRLVHPDRLQGVMLCFSHILVRHRDVPSGLISFNLPLWTGAPPAPDRTREEALAFAQELEGRARREPQRFAELASEHSEDVATRTLGGSVGVVRAAEISRYPVVLDALAALSPGEVSRVVETGYGFHILLRRSPPPPGVVSGSRIVIGHADAPWLERFFARRPIPPRTRAEAEVLARNLFERARANPSQFEALVAEYSEHDDALRQGDFGSWPALAATPFPREVEVLRGLALGDVAPPLDSLFGIQILQRTAERPRARYSATLIEQMFDPHLPPEDPRSEASVAAAFRTISGQVTAEPSRFEEYQNSLCCAVIQTWTEGAGSAPLEQMLVRLKPGQIAPAPVRLAYSYALVKRVSTEGPSPPPSFDLPVPERADFDALLTRWMGPDLAREAAAIAEPLQAGSKQAAEVAAVHEAFAAALARGEAATFEALQTQLRPLLGARYGEYKALLDKRVEALVLHNASLESPLELPRMDL
jgi:parvulin-like peptidyl-prolyl isomerase